MRLDKYLKVSRIIKRRTVAKEACDSGKILINDKVAKASSEVKQGDILEVKIGAKPLKVEVELIKEHVKKEEASSLYKKIENNT